MNKTSIPVQNIYFLLCYAWNHLQETGYAGTRTEGCDRIWDLLSKVLLRSAQQLTKRGLHRSYVLQRETRVRPKGKILFAEDVRHPMRRTPAKTCEYDELSADILPNQIIYSTLFLLQRNQTIDKSILNELRETSSAWSGIDRPIVSPRVFRRIGLHRNMRHYRFALNVCELIHRAYLPTETDGQSRFRDFLQDEATMGTLFEQFVRNFLVKEQSHFKVSSPQVRWDVDESLSSATGLRLLPSMRTDIVLEAGNDRLIIDCKFYQDAFQRHHDVRKFISSHLYQLFTYLKNQEVQDGWKNCKGMLLYPTTQESMDERVSIGGHEIRVASINLDQPWDSITIALLALFRH